jgi:hypothetical protein
MQKIVIAQNSESEHTDALIGLIEALFPECEVQVTSADRGISKKRKERNVSSQENSLSHRF